MKKGYLIGIDVGTSATKASLYDFELNLIDTSTRGYDIDTPFPGWSQQHPDTWWLATKDAINELAQKQDLTLIKSIGITGQMHGLVMLDSAGKPLRPSIIWCDQRSDTECGEITEMIGKNRLIDITANPALPGFTASKIRWVAKHEPDIFAQCAHILLPKDYIRYKLSGVFATDMNDASGMQLLDIANRRWSPDMLSALNIREDQLPKLYEGSEICCVVDEAGFRQTGIAKGTPIVAGAGDQAASAIGNGIVSEGAISLTIGSSGVLFATTKRPIIEQEVAIIHFAMRYLNSGT
jgi:xylulokinase